MKKLSLLINRLKKVRLLPFLIIMLERAAGQERAKARSLMLMTRMSSQL